METLKKLKKFVLRLLQTKSLILSLAFVIFATFGVFIASRLSQQTQNARSSAHGGPVQDGGTCSNSSQCRGTCCACGKCGGITQTCNQVCGVGVAPSTPPPPNKGQQPGGSSAPSTSSPGTGGTCSGSYPTAQLCFGYGYDSYRLDGSTCYKCHNTSGNNCAAVQQSSTSLCNSNPSGTSPTSTPTGSSGTLDSNGNCTGSNLGKSFCSGSFSEVCTQVGYPPQKTTCSSGCNASTGACNSTQIALAPTPTPVPAAKPISTPTNSSPIATAKPTPTPTSKPTSLPTAISTPTPQPNNTACTTNSQCASKYCDQIAQTCQPPQTGPIGTVQVSTKTYTGGNVGPCSGISQPQAVCSNGNVIICNTTTSFTCPNGCEAGSCKSAPTIAQVPSSSSKPTPTPTPTSRATIGDAIAGAANTALTILQGSQVPSGSCPINSTPKYLLSSGVSKPTIINCICSTGTIINVGQSCPISLPSIFQTIADDISKAARGIVYTVTNQNTTSSGNSIKTNQTTSPYCDHQACPNGCAVETSTGGICNSPQTNLVQNISATQCASQYAGCPGQNNSCVPHNGTNSGYRCCFGYYQNESYPCTSGYFESQASCNTINGCYHPSTGVNGSGTCIPNGSYFGQSVCANSPVQNGQYTLVNGQGVSDYFSQTDPIWSDVPLPQDCSTPGRGNTIANAGCGPMSVLNIINNSGHGAEVSHTREGVTNFINQSYPGMSCGGTGIAQNVQVLNSYHLDTDYISCNGTSDCQQEITRYIQNGAQVLILIQISTNGGAPVGHFVVANGIDAQGNLEIVDPDYQSYNGREVVIAGAVAVRPN